jgi:hypothetical protein
MEDVSKALVVVVVSVLLVGATAPVAAGFGDGETAAGTGDDGAAGTNGLDAAIQEITTYNYTAQNAVAVDGDVAYVISDGQIVAVDLSTGAQIDSFDAPDGTNRGLAYGGGSLWYADAAASAFDGEILELDPATGEVRSRIHTSYDPYGLAFGDGSLWAGEVTGAPNTVREFAPNGTQVGQFTIDGPAGSTGPNGLAYFNGTVWVGTSDGLYDLGPNGAVQQSFESRETGYKGLASTGTILYGPDETGNLSVLRRVGDEPSGPPAPPDATGVSTGDPHLITFDGLAYDFQAAGEFVLVREPGGPFEVQARQVPVDDRADVTVNTAVATRLDGHTLTVDARDATPVSVDGEPVAVNATTPVSVGDGRVFYDADASMYTVVYPGTDGDVDDGDTQLVADVVGDRIDVTVHVDPEAHAGLTGLLGDADGDPADDLGLANGTTLPRSPAFDALYGPFREGWLLNGSTSLFDYDDGNGPSTYADPSVPTDPVTLEDFDDAAVEDARQMALDAGLTEGTVNFRNALIDYLLTGDTSYFDSADDAPETPEANLTVPEDPVRNLTGTTVEGFEDGDLAEYRDVDSARTTTETAYAGNRSLVITDRNDDIDTDAQGLIGNKINRTFEPTAPSRLATAIRADNGAYNTVQVQWKNASGSVLHSTMVLNYHGELYYGGKSHTTLQSADGHTWYYVELVDIDWEADVVGEIRVNGQPRATNVSFANPGDSVSEVQMRVHDGATGSVGYFDEVTVGGGETPRDPADGPTVDVAVDDTVPPGTETTINVTGTNVSELRITGETGGWVVNDTTPSRLTTLPTPGELPYRAQPDDTWGQLYGASGAHSFAVVATPPAGTGTYNFTARGFDDGANVSQSFTVEVRQTDHESGVTQRLFDAVAGSDGTLDRTEVVAALRAYFEDGAVGKAPISREDVIQLVQYYLRQ